MASNSQVAVPARSPTRPAKKPVIKLEVDLEKREVSVVPSPQAKKFKPRTVLKRSLSQSARVLTNKAN